MSDSADLNEWRARAEDAREAERELREALAHARTIRAPHAERLQDQLDAAHRNRLDAEAALATALEQASSTDDDAAAELDELEQQLGSERLIGTGATAGDRIRSLAQSAATAAAEAGLQSAGVPAPVARKIARSKTGQAALKWGSRWGILVTVTTPLLAVLMVASLLVLVIGGTGGSWDVEPSESAAEAIPSAYLAAYRAAGDSYDIPWTLLAGLGTKATYNGYVDPYQRSVPTDFPGSSASRQVPSAFVVGDSLTVGSKKALEAAFGAKSIPVDVVAENGQRLQWGLDRLSTRQITQYPPTNEAVVVALGTNDNKEDLEGFAKRIDQVMNRVDEQAPVFWLTIDMPGAGGLNDELYAAAERYPGRLQVLDWAGYRAQASIEHSPDGIHYNPDGYAARAAYIADAVSGYALSTPGAPVTGAGTMKIPEGSCPDLEHPVPTKHKAGQAVGPLMLVPELFQQYGVTTTYEELQNICTSANLLAGRLAVARDEVAAEQTLDVENLRDQAQDGDANAVTALRRFWAQVVNRAGVLGDPRSTACTPPERGNLDKDQWVALTVRAVWACELSTEELAMAVAASEADGVWTYTTAGKGESIARAIDEALQVAYAYSQWGTADCDPAATYAGVFPLPDTALEAFGTAAEKKKGRCDVVTNVTVAARAFVRGERVPVNSRPATIGPAGAETPAPYRPLWGGWDQMGLVTGPSFEREAFARNGRRTDVRTVDSCLRFARRSLLNAAKAPASPLTGATLGTVNAFVNGDATPEQTASLDAYLASLADGMVASGCVADGSEPDATPVALNRMEAWGLLRAVTEGEGQPAPAAGTEPKTYTSVTDVVDVYGAWPAFAARIQAVNGTLFTTTPTPGITALVDRLSSYALSVETPMVVNGYSENGVTAGEAVVAIAQRYGGLYEGDEIPAGALGFGGLVDGGIGILPADFENGLGALFNTYGSQYGIDPRLLAAIAEQESGFNPTSNCPVAENPGRAYGLMQWEADRATGLVRGENFDPCGDPAISVERTGRVMRDMYREYVKQFPAADVATRWTGVFIRYNAGPTIARKFMEQGLPAVNAYQMTAACEAELGNVCGEAKVREVSNYGPGIITKWEKYQKKYPAAILGAAQTAIAGDTCPTESQVVAAIPGRDVFRPGYPAKKDISLKELCERSVAQARSPEAARAILYAFANLGAEYSLPGRNRRNPNQFDCSSFVSRAYYLDGKPEGIPTAKNGGNAPWGSIMEHTSGRVKWTVPTLRNDARPGDLIFTPTHVMMLLSDGYKIHAPQTGDVVNASPAYNTNEIRSWMAVDPEQARLHPWQAG